MDWDALVIGPTVEIFGEPVTYIPFAASPIFDGKSFGITAVFDEAYLDAAQLGAPGLTSARPLLGAQVSQFPAGFDPEQVQGDRFVVKRTGICYVVETAKTDSHGWCLFKANLAP